MSITATETMTGVALLQFGHFQRFITARIVDILGRSGLNHGGVANDVRRGALAEGLGLNLFAQECYQVLAGGTPSGTAPLGQRFRGVVPDAPENSWAMPGARWQDVVRPYTKEDVEQLRGTVKIEYSVRFPTPLTNSEPPGVSKG